MAKNKMTHFICRELLYDYAIGHLESKRAKEVEDFIENHADLKEELEKIKSAIHYISDLKRITISQPYHQKLLEKFHKESKTYYIKKAASASAKWGGAAAAIVLIFIYFPSERLVEYFQRDPNKVVIAQVETSDDLNNLPVTMHGDLGDELDEILVADKDIQDDATLLQQEDPNLLELSPDEKVSLKEKLKKQDEDLKVADEIESKKEIEKVEESRDFKKHKGRLYRAFLNVNEKEVVSRAILQKLKELGASKGGSVKLGWEKPNKNSYFHFIITRSNFEIFKTYLNTIKEVNINSYPHPRVIEDGYIRMILEVEEI